MPWSLAATVTLSPGGELYVQPSFSDPQSAFVTIATTGLPRGIPLLYATPVVFGALAPTGVIGGRLQSTLVQPNLGAFLRPAHNSLGFPGWFLHLYAVRRPNGFPIVVNVYRGSP